MWDVTSVSHGEGSHQPGEVFCAERGRSCHAHSSLRADGEQPWWWLQGSVGWEHGVSLLVQAALRSVGMLWAVLGLCAAMGWLRLAEEWSDGVGHPRLAGCGGAGSAAKRMHPGILPSMFRGEAGSGCAWNFSL